MAGESTPLRCLLLSPVAPPDPENGDAQYTLDLCREPPPGVEYVPYTEAIARGEAAWGPSVQDPATWRRPLRALPAASARAALHVVRHSGLLLPEPVRWLRVGPAFDLVHVHGIPVRLLGPHPPVVLTDSAGTFWHWTAGRGFDPQRVDRLLRRERRLARLLGYVHATANPEAADRLLLFVGAGRGLIARTGADVAAAAVCPPGVPPPTRGPRSDGRTLLIVIRAFEIKGGPDALRILERVRRELPDARLLVAGPEPRGPVEGVEWLGLVDRERLYEEVYPRADVFVYPTRFDCAPLVVQEALAHGLPVVAPAAFALPELVRDGETGRLFRPGAIDDAAAATVELLRDEPLRRRLGEAARRDYRLRFSIERRNEVLGDAYAGAIAAASRR